MSEKNFKSSSEIFLDRRDAERFGDDPNAIDRMKLGNCIRSASGKWSQKVGDEYFELDSAEQKRLEEKWKQMHK